MLADRLGWVFAAHPFTFVKSIRHLEADGDVCDPELLD